MQKVTLAGGCFWCLENAFYNQQGVLSCQVGYTGGTTVNPTYEAVCGGSTGHVEAIELLIDPAKITFLQLLNLFWRQIDPFDATGQFHDRGSSYQSAIFYHDEMQKEQALFSKAEVERLFGRQVATTIRAATVFYAAEASHQAYCLKHPFEYAAYSKGHEARLKELWQDKQMPIGSQNRRAYLTPLQYRVTQEGGTEKAFDNPYWDNKEEGIYVDILTGEPLFSSKDKFESHTGWPSFTQAIEGSKLELVVDDSYGMQRIEVLAKSSGSHLGHLFEDGPAPRGQRYCMNSAALRFIPADKVKNS